MLGWLCSCFLKRGYEYLRALRVQKDWMEGKEWMISVTSHSILILCKIIPEYVNMWWLHFKGLQCGGSGIEPACQCKRHGFDPWVRKMPWRRKWQPTPVFLPGESHGQRSLVDYSPWDRKRIGHDWATKQQQQQGERNLHSWKGYLWPSDILNQG